MKNPIASRDEPVDVQKMCSTPTKKISLIHRATPSSIRSVIRTPGEGVSIEKKHRTSLKNMRRMKTFKTFSKESPELTASSSSDFSDQEEREGICLPRRPATEGRINKYALLEERANLKLSLRYSDDEERQDSPASIWSPLDIESVQRRLPFDDDKGLKIQTSVQNKDSTFQEYYVLSPFNPSPESVTQPAYDMYMPNPQAVYQLRSSEFDPTPFQLEIPSLDELLMSSKICEIFGKLDKHSQTSVLRGTKLANLEGQLGSTSSTLKADDVRIEKIYRADNEFGHGIVEVALLSSQKLRQIFVCFTASNNLQAKPIRSKKEVLADFHILHPKQKVPVHPILRDVYFSKGLENSVNDLMEDLTTENPFFDVVFTGHSFGAGLATIGAMRYAVLQPMIRVSCNAFGSPRVGGTEFRSLVHSLPNLKVTRVQNGLDPYVVMPEVSGGWTHVGHTITLSTSASMLKSKDVPSLDVRAYKFDKRPRICHSSFKSGLSAITKKSTGKTDHEINSYTRALYKFKENRISWVKSYVGEEGKGVNGINNESRFVV